MLASAMICSRQSLHVHARLLWPSRSGGAVPDHDAADAFVALCTAILYAEGACWAATAGDRT